MIGSAIGGSKSLKSLSINACNLNESNFLELFFAGLLKNDTLEMLDLSDNQITDEQALPIILYIKKQAENRDTSLW